MSKPFDPTRPVQTRNGRMRWDADGKYLEQPMGLSGKPDGWDIVNTPQKRTGWINIFADEYSRRPWAAKDIYETEAAARNAGLAMVSYVATVQIEWEE